MGIYERILSMITFPKGNVKVLTIDIPTLIMIQKFLASLFLILVTTTLLPPTGSLYGQNVTNKWSTAETEALFGLPMTQAERDSMQRNLEDQLRQFESLRSVSLQNSRSPVLYFNPLPYGWKWPEVPSKASTYTFPNAVSTINQPESLAYASVAELSVLIKEKKISSETLTRMYLDRLKRFNKDLAFVVTLLEEDAIKRAKAMDNEISQGIYRGPLHGIPYGAKDLLAYPGYKTTWGAMPYKDQVINETAAVIEKLDEAGAVLVAKLTLGALAWGEVWFDGMTKNPWNLNQGSSGSSAGSASAVSAGAVPFAIGSETLGSIVSPSTRCGVTGLRPTFGRVSRHGAMALSWSMDKLGPICRTAEDCGMIFEAIQGYDGRDLSTFNLPYHYDTQKPLSKIRVGYFKSLFEADYPNKKNDQAILEVLRNQGVELIEVSLPDFPSNALSFILSAEAAAAFDELTRSNRDDLLVRQVRNAWPNVFRSARFVPAVEYINANRARGLLIDAMDQALKSVDVVVSPSFGGAQLQMTNLTGHPALVMPNGFSENGSPTSISLVGQLFGEADLVRVAAEIQKHSDFHKKQPPLFSVK